MPCRDGEFVFVSERKFTRIFNLLIQRSSRPLRVVFVVKTDGYHVLQNALQMDGIQVYGVVSDGVMDQISNDDTFLVKIFSNKRKVFWDAKILLDYVN